MFSLAIDAIRSRRPPRPSPAGEAAGFERLRLADGRLVNVRPIRPQDVSLQREFVRSLSPLARYRRFHGPVAELPESMLRYLCEADGVSHLALLAARVDTEGNETQVAEARWVRHKAPADPSIADFAIAVADAWQGIGLGSLLLDRLIRTAAAAGLRELRGDVLAGNPPMQGLLLRHGWRLRGDPDDPDIYVARFDLGRTFLSAANEPVAALRS